MEKETYTFDGRDILEKVSNLLEGEKAKAFLVKFYGKRWSFQEGNLERDLPVSAPKGFDIGKGEGIVIYGWDELPLDKKEKLIKIININGD